MPQPGETAGTHWSYGGHWGETSHDAQFCINGLFWPDRQPHPTAYEAKACQAPVHISTVACQLVNDSQHFPAQFKVEWFSESRFDFTETRMFDGHSLPRNLVCEATVDCAGIPVALDSKGRGGLFSLSKEQVRQLVRGHALILTVVVKLEAATPWAPAGHIVATSQHRLQPDLTRWSPEMFAQWDRENQAPTVSVESFKPGLGQLGFRTRSFEIVFDTEQGRPLWVQPERGERIPIAAGSGVNLYRAPTDNDNGSNMTVFDPLAVSSWEGVDDCRCVRAKP